MQDRFRLLFLLTLLLSIGTSMADDLFQAAGIGDLNKIEAQSEKIDAVDPRSGLTAWQIAKINGRDEAANLLAEKGADPKTKFPHPAETLAKFLAGHAQPNAPGASVLVAKDGQIVFAGGVGLADLDSKEQITAETVFRIGSITKQFVATAILLLADEGRLSVKDKLSKYYPDWPRGDEITLHHLLTHSSGMASFTALPNFEPWDPTTVDEVIATFRDQPHGFDPGKDWHYNNSGYLLLGEIASSVAGKPYQQLLAERVFDPEKIRTTGAHRPELDLEPEARGYVQSEGKGPWELPERDWHMSHAAGAGEFYSTIGDLYRWNEAVYGGRVLKPETLKMAHTPAGIESESPLAAQGMVYGYGWVIEKRRGLNFIWHNGGIPGFYSSIVRFPDQNLTIVALSNSSTPPAGLEPDTIIEIAGSLWLWEEMESQSSFRSREIEIDPAKLTDYAGAFDLKMLGVMRFRVEEGRLLGRLANQPWNPVTPTGEDIWEFPKQKAKFIFSRDDAGSVVSVRLEQRGLKVTGEVFEEPETAELTRQQLLEFAGSYKLGAAGKFVFRIDDEGSLMAKLGNQSEFQYFPSAETDDRVFCRAVRADIQFERDDEGAVNALVLHQGGAKMRALKE
ncbi:MAG: CubicO group peptidase (beta-lactamase class C family) [Verrucomicrobiales bacterium]|jgi:CubicO group peptidase (beta-lactamase class C family)